MKRQPVSISRQTRHRQPRAILHLRNLYNYFYCSPDQSRQSSTACIRHDSTATNPVKKYHTRNERSSLWYSNRFNVRGISLLAVGSHETRPARSNTSKKQRKCLSGQNPRQKKVENLGLSQPSTMAKGKQSASAPMERQRFYFQFVTTPTADTPGTTLLLHFDSRRYLFGRIAEGTQRACIQRGVGIKKLRSLFLTGPTAWSSIGGVLGMVLTMADVQADEVDESTGKRPKLRIYGGPKLTHSVACARRFVFRTGMPVEIHEANARNPGLFKQPSYMDENVNVWSVAVSRRGRSGVGSPRLPDGRSQSPATVDREQKLRANIVQNMFDSDWRKDRLIESRFDEVKLPALIWVRNPDSKDLTYIQCNSMADAPQLQPSSKVLVRNAWPASLVEEVPPVNNIAGSVAMSYIVKGKPQRGKFIIDKAKALGVKPGPNYARLAAGESITMEDGKVITPDMVLGATEPAKGMAIFDVPTEEYIEDLTEKIDNLKNGPMEGIETVSWILGGGVFQSPSFSHLMDSLSGMRHIISSPDAGANCVSLDSAAASSIRLAQVRPECFIVPLYSDEPLVKQSPFGSNSTLAQRGLVVQISPKTVVNYDEVPPALDMEASKASYSSILKPLLPQDIQAPAETSPYDDVQILTLGTGSAVPSKYRNVSATLVRIPGLGSYLFDCGENTMGMLRRAYDPSQLDAVLIDLRMIWISHLHADHHLGTMSVISAKQEVMQRLGKKDPQLHIVSEPKMADYLNDFDSVQSSVTSVFIGVMNSELSFKNGKYYGAPVHLSQTSLKIKEFLTTRVNHCHGAQACSVTFDNGFKFSYSGDCRPSAQFAKIGIDSDVLLHEATFDDGLEGDAMAKKHSTTAEALGVAHAMKAKNVILTHFSQRYQKIPVLNNVKLDKVRLEDSLDTDEAGPIEENTTAQSIEQIPDGSQSAKTKPVFTSNGDQKSASQLQSVAQQMNVCVAFDLMSVTVKQIQDMYRYYPAIEKMLEYELEKAEAKREERREATERLRSEKDETNSSKQSQASPKSTNPKNGNIYERINRTKVRGNADSKDLATNPGVSRSGGETSITTSTGQQSPL